MASISTASNGTRRILVVTKHRERKAVHLGKIPLKTAEEICRRIETINAAAIAGVAMDGDTAAWLSKIGDGLYERLVVAGLVQSRTPAAACNVPSLGAFVDAFLAGRDDLKPNTRMTFMQTRKALVKHFGEDRPIDAVSAGDADEWVAALRKEYSPATIATFIKRARQMFRHATRKKILVESPFREIKVPSQVNKAREEFVPMETVDQLIQAAPGHDWRCIIALARYGGLRTPSETLALKWQDVDWERNRVTVFSPKLEHLPSRGIRQIPLFPELRVILEQAFDAAPEGAVYVVGRYRDGQQNLRTQFLRILRKAGVKPWGRLFHNLRGSRETELVQDFPVHVVAHWLGNTPKVATAHYLQIRDKDYERAAQSRAQSDARGAQNTAQHASAASRKTSQNELENLEIMGRSCVFAGNAEETEYPRQESNL
jgi:integrase